jgi:DNA-binding NarL/FixJ family response regulator
MKHIRIAIVEDHESVRLGLRTELSHHDDIEIIGEAVTVEEAIALLLARAPDIALLDMEIPGENPNDDGISVLAALRKAKSTTKILVYTGWKTEAYILSALAEDVSGYILKDERLSVVTEAIRAIGNKTVTDGWFSHEVREKIRNSKQSGAKLTPRELDVLPLLSKRNEEIAEELNMSKHTAKRHTQNIFAKLSVSSRAAALAEAYSRGLVPRKS